MKKLYFSLMALFVLSGGVAFAYDEPTFQESSKVNNSPYSQREAYREIKLVRYAGNTANDAGLVSGDAVAYSIVSADGVTVFKTTQSEDSAFAGIVCTTIPSSNASAIHYSEDAGRRNWGYIVVYGPANATAGAGGTGNANFGDPFIMSSDSGKVGNIAFASGAVSKSYLEDAATSGGYFLQSADATSTSIKVFVKAT